MQVEVSRTAIEVDSVLAISERRTAQPQADESNKHAAAFKGGEESYALVLPAGSHRGVSPNSIQ